MDSQVRGQASSAQKWGVMTPLTPALETGPKRAQGPWEVAWAGCALGALPTSGQHDTLA